MRHGGGDNVEYDDSPQLVEASFGGNRVVSVSASSNGSFAVTENGQLYAWGQNDNGNLGLGRSMDNRGCAEVNEPGLTVTVVDSFSSGGIAQLATGFHSSITLMKNGDVYVWGNNEDGNLGIEGDDGDELEICTSRFGIICTGRVTKYLKTIPILLKSGMISSQIALVSASEENLFAMDNQGYVYSWGGGNVGIDNITNDIQSSQIILRGVNMPNITNIFIDFDEDNVADSDELCSNIVNNNNGEVVTCNIPVEDAASLVGEEYRIGIELDGGQIVLSEFTFAYKSVKGIN